MCVLDGAKLGLGLCQVLPQVHYGHGRPWISDLGDFVSLLSFTSFPFFSSFVLLTILVGHTHFDCGTLFEYGLKVALHSLQLLNRALLYIWYFNGFKQKQTNTHRFQVKEK